MYRPLIGIAALGVLIGMPALAADMPLKAPPMAPVWSWSGAYVGVNFGYGWSSGSSQITYSSPTTGFSGTAPGLNPTGVLGGAQIGYNWQFNSFVLGVEADIQGASIQDQYNVTVASNGGPLGAVASERLDWFDTVRGRAGFAFNRTLVYATGGYAYGSVSDQAFLTNGGATALLTHGHASSGYAIGGGLEQFLGSGWSVKAEYLYLNLGSEIVSGVSSNGVALNSTTINSKFNIVRAGLNYRF